MENRRDFLAKTLAALASTVVTGGAPFSRKDFIWAKSGAVFNWRQRRCDDSRFACTGREEDAPLIFLNGQLLRRKDAHVVFMITGPRGRIVRIKAHADGRLCVKRIYCRRGWERWACQRFLFDKLTGCVEAAKHRNPSIHAKLVEYVYGPFAMQPGTYVVDTKEIVLPPRKSQRGEEHSLQIRMGEALTEAIGT